MPTIAWIAVGVGALPLLYVVFAFNRLVAYRNEVRNSFSQMDVQMKRRHDLIPNLVEAVKGVMKFEKETLENIVKARASAMSAMSATSASSAKGGGSDMGAGGAGGVIGLAGRALAEGRLSALIGQILAVWENYPELKSSRNALALQDELSSTENRIAYSRGHYNDVVANFNTLIEQFPSSIVARLFAFRKREFFRAVGEERQPSEISLG